MLWLSFHFYFVLFWCLLAFTVTGNSLTTWLKYTLKAQNKEPNYNFLHNLTIFREIYVFPRTLDDGFFNSDLTCL